MDGIGGYFNGRITLDDAYGGPTTRFARIVTRKTIPPRGVLSRDRFRYVILY
jgi:hypothetical protein